MNMCRNGLHDKDVTGRTKDGSCILCKHATRRRLYAKHREKERARNAKYRAEHREKERARHARYRAEHLEEVRAQKREYMRHYNATEAARISWENYNYSTKGQLRNIRANAARRQRENYVV